jgi:hypothetical protein
MTEQEIRAAADGIRDTLSTIDAGSLEATSVQRAFLAGAEHALRAVLGEVELESSLVS